MIYLDHAAATPVSAKALAAMMPYFTEDFFNPSAPYLPAKHVREAYESAKNQIAHCIGAKGADLVITAGATESINLAFTARHSKALVLATEHAAVLAAAKTGDYELISVDKTGLIQLDDLRQKLTDEVDFVSISLANNELGTIQPMADIAELIRQVRQNRLARGINTPLYFHSDASQALNLMDISVSRLGVDLLTLNAAKCGGPKGVGALYLAHGVKISPLTVGGGQERGLRSGTENVPGVVGFATAAEDAKTHLTYHRKQYQEMAKILRQELSQISQKVTKTPAPNQNSAPHTSIVAQDAKNVKHKPHQTASEPTFSDNIKHNFNLEIPQPLFLGNPKHQLANFVSVCFPGIDAERLIYKLEQEGILVSTGAACAANKGTKSHVLAAIGLSDVEIAGSLRISLGSTNNLDQIKQAAGIIAKTVVNEYQRVASAKRCTFRESPETKLTSVCRERLKERSADREEREPREDGRSSGSLETNASKLGSMDACSEEDNDCKLEENYNV